MKKHQKTPTIPQERDETIRKEIIGLLKIDSLPIGALSREIRQSEKEIFEHLKQIQKSMNLRMTPAECGSCGYVFEKRERLKKPGKCPKCRSTFIEEPLFSIDEPWQCNNCCLVIDGRFRPFDAVTFRHRLSAGLALSLVVQRWGLFLGGFLLGFLIALRVFYSDPLRFVY